ncbi:glycosyltransferase [Irregularibacter muris]|uniref:Glycosyltransferase n=1 Tax=Irregularibacter muris TaxID=1796619 RepID=A0AAE3L4M1_9FIRM|nr:glycosyltransferase [Irregularibacter muris]MCR1900273.1 glycosyltransferase [Irregularibacter muris]
MIEISLCMIVRDEESVLKRCLDSIYDIVDEIIIVDTGSIDRTKEIAKLYTDKIYDFKWIDDFSAARNFSFSKGTKEYLMWLDADDFILEEDRIKLKNFKENTEPIYDQIFMKYNVGFDDQGNVTLSYYRERIFRRSMDFKWVEPVHEVINPGGDIYYLDIAIVHGEKVRKKNDKRNLNIYENILAKNQTLSPRGSYYYARELYYNQLYGKAIKYFLEFLDSNKGWQEDCIQACKLLSLCYAKMGDSINQLRILFRSFEYHVPRADICCEIGQIYFERSNYESAVFWYEMAIKKKNLIENNGFIYHDYYGYIPALQCCLSYYRLGNIEKAIYYNDLAGTYKPKSPAFLYNKEFFNRIDK